MSAPYGVASQQCSCKRTKEHLHYSSNHDFFVMFGLVLLLFAEAVSFVQGWVKGSTTIYLSNAVIEQYQTVASKIAQLTTPYEYLNWLALGIELITLLLAILAVASLHWIKERNTHDAAIVGTVATFIIGMITKQYYISATDVALTRLPSMVDPDVLTTARQVQEEFQRKYGFWGTPAPDAVNILCSLASLGLFIAALITTQHFRVWQPTPALAVAPTTPPIQESVILTVDTSAAVAPTTVMPAMPTKFCRFCGAKIVRDSKFCEECGAKLT